MSIQTIDAPSVKSNLTKATCLIDVRTPIEFQEVHAVGAVNIPLDQISREKLPSDCKEIALLCKSGARASKAAEKLAKEGLDKIIVVNGGTEAWIASGLPVECSSKAVMSLERQVRLTVGILVLLSSVLALTVSPWFLALAVFVSCGLIFSAVTNTCGMAMMLAKMPWNQAASCNLSPKAVTK